MEKKFKTDQEEFWSGHFGIEYIDRNVGDKLLASNLYFFSNILKRINGLNSVIEFGSNVGMNLKALKLLMPHVELSGIEINETAYHELLKIGNVKGYHASILEFIPDYKRELALIKGVLIHINPEELKTVYQKLYESSSKYICIAEYYNPSPVELNYRGHTGKLFKRDFAGEMMNKFPDLELVDYGFAYRGDYLFPQDDITWFLLKK